MGQCEHSIMMIGNKSWPNNSNKLIKFLGTNWFSLDRCHNDTVTKRGLDSSASATFGCLFFDARWSMGVVGRGYESVWGPIIGRRLVGECRHVDVVILLIIFPTILSLLFAYSLWTTSRCKRRFYSTLSSHFSGEYNHSTILVDLQHLIKEQKQTQLKFSYFFFKDFPTKYIHEPWTAPESVQKAAKCIIGQHYPFPMVNHATASKTNLKRMRQVYQQLYNNIT